MARKKQNEKSIIESTLFMYAAMVLTRVLGLVFNIPFYALLGDNAYYIYSSAYAIYNLFLDISTLGIPVAMSIIISEYNSLKKYKSKQKAYSIGLKSTTVLALGSFLFLELFARPIARIYYVESAVVPLDDIVLAIRIVGMCLLVVPFLGIKRGYLQGHRLFDSSSLSQLLEQIVRVVFVLTSAYLIIDVLKKGTTLGVFVSLVGTCIAGLAALLFINWQIRKNRDILTDEQDDDEVVESTRKMLRKVWIYCFTISSVNVFQSVHNVIRVNLLNSSLTNLGFAGPEVLNITNNMSQLAPKTCLIISSLSMALTTSITPHVAGSFAQNDYAGVRSKLRQSIGIVLAISTPLSIGMILLAKPVHALLYDYDSFGFGALILQFDIILNSINNLTMVFTSALQGMNRKKFVCVSTIICYAVSLILEVPFIYLFNFIGIKPYLGPMVSCIIGHIVLLVLQARVLKETVNYDLQTILPSIRDLILPLGLMSVAVVIMEYLLPIPVAARRLKLLVYCFVYAIGGGIVYGLMGLKTGALNDLMESDRIKGIIDRINARIKK